MTNLGISSRPAQPSELDQLVANWDRHVTVKQPPVDFGAYQPELPDFPLCHVPFASHPAFFNAAPEKKLRVLAGAWIWYNEKTQALEERIVNPACLLILHDTFEGAQTSAIKRSISQTMIDEQYHAYMSMSPSIFTRERRELTGLAFGSPFVVSEYERLCERLLCKREKHILLLSFMIVAELTINAYLSLLSGDHSIQPINRLITNNHKKDEARHARIIKNVGRKIFLNFNEKDRQDCINFISLALRIFTKAEFDPWLRILNHVGFEEADELIEYGRTQQGGKPLFRECQALRKFATELEFADQIEFFTSRDIPHVPS